MSEATIFYAWQSDRRQQFNHYFIRDAARDAVKSLLADADIDEAIRLDHDTKGVPGTRDIAQTIFNKIDACSIFVADVTFVGRTDEPRSKSLPNPNVTYGRVSPNQGGGCLV